VSELVRNVGAKFSCSKAPSVSFADTSPVYAGLSGESFSYEGQLDLAGGDGGLCGSRWGRFVDAGDGFSDEQGGADAFGEPDWGNVLAAALAGGDAEQEIGDERGEYL